MLTIADLNKLARARLDDADALLAAGRYDGAAYLCGYAIEVALKARICKTMNWTEFPEGAGEWKEHYKFLKVHHLANLLKWSGRENQILNPPHAQNWALVRAWTPEDRYKLAGSMQLPQVTAIVAATRALLVILLPRR